MARFVSPSDRRAWEEAGKPAFLAHGFRVHTGDEFLPAGSFSDDLRNATALARMPGDPVQLSNWLCGRVNDSERGSGSGNGVPGSVRTIELVAELLQNPAATPQRRTALYEAEALVPGVEKLGEAEDEIGRRGVAIGARSDNSGLLEQYSLLFDPRAARILASETAMLEPRPGHGGDRLPLLVGSTVYVSQGRTRFLRVRPHRNLTSSFTLG